MRKGEQMTSAQQILEAVQQHLAGRGLDPMKVTMEADLVGDLDLDSLDTMELTLGMEERFNIEIPDDELEELRTIGDAVSLVERKTSVSA
jgi:acyl carrier protein